MVGWTDCVINDAQRNCNRIATRTTKQLQQFHENNNTTQIPLASLLFEGNKHVYKRSGSCKEQTQCQLFATKKTSRPTRHIFRLASTTCMVFKIYNLHWHLQVQHMRNNCFQYQVRNISFSFLFFSFVRFALVFRFCGTFLPDGHRYLIFYCIVHIIDVCMEICSCVD